MKRDLLALGFKVFHVCWMSVALGIAMELVVLVVLLATGGQPSANSFAISVLPRVSWSVVVCASLAISTALPRFSVPASGITGLLVAPTMTLAAKVLQKVLTEALSGAAAALNIPLVLGLAAIKGVEYLILGSIVAWLAARGHRFLVALGVGAGVGIVFASIVTAINALGGALPVALVAGFINEMLFPIGCVIILFGADQLGRLMAGAMAEGNSTRTSA